MIQESLCKNVFVVALHYAAISSHPRRKPEFLLTYTFTLHAGSPTPCSNTVLQYSRTLSTAKWFHTHILARASGQKCIALNEMKDKPVSEVIPAVAAFNSVVFVCMQQAYRTSSPGSLSHGDSFNKGRPKDKSESTQTCKQDKELQVVAIALVLVFALMLPLYLSAVMDDVTTELLMTITANKSQPPARKFRIERSSGSQVPLTFESNPEQVIEWLNSKGFSKP